jgi:bla regulator protein BlaR1
MSFVEMALSNALVAAVLAVLALIVGLVSRRPALVHALWLLVLLKLLTPPMIRLSVPWPVPTVSTAQVAADEPETPQLPAQEDSEADLFFVEDFEESWSEFAQEQPDPVATPVAPLWLWVWVVGSAGWFGLAVWRVGQFHLRLRRGRPASEELLHRVKRLAQQLGLTRVPRVLLVSGSLPPLVWAIGRPVVLLPEQLPERLDPQKLDTLLLHELAHIRRGDHWVRWLEFVALGLYWWNPVVWLARVQLREAEEQCCDAWVLRAQPGSARTYATALVDALDFLATGSASGLPASAISPVADLKRRLYMILRNDVSPRLSPSAGVGVLLLAALLLPLMPGLSHAQPDVIFLQSVSQDASEELKALEAQIKAQKEALNALVEKAAALKKKAAEGKPAQGKESKEVKYGVTIVRDDDKKAEGVILVEIVATDKKEDVDALIEQLRKALPKDMAKRVMIVKRADAKNVKVTGMQLQLAPEGGKVIRQAPLMPPLPPKPPIPYVVPLPKPDKRIEQLEQKLDGVMKALEQMRKELKDKK